MSNKKILAVDFDGVIHKYSHGWMDGSCYDEPMEGALEMIQKLMEAGYQIVVFTARQPQGDVKDWLEKYNFPVMDITNEKPMALAYIDDRAIRFTNWRDIGNYFK